MKLYTGADCSKCTEAKGIIDNKEIEVEIVDYDSSIREHRDLRAMGVPILATGRVDSMTLLPEVLIGQQVVDYLQSYKK
jgi:glutaredoxin